MKAYELMAIFKSSLNEGEKPDIEKLNKLVTKLKGKVQATDDWGEKTMTYSIKGHERGHYVVYQVQLPEDKVKSLQQKLTLETDILRYLLITLDS